MTAEKGTWCTLQGHSKAVPEQCLDLETNKHR